ncbi:hypothetical protein EK904_002904 [Melospiza melodia maxima]|nr:hypothetical protein EK904_002904 [Melospiza melodia maxima]
MSWCTCEPEPCPAADPPCGPCPLGSSCTECCVRQCQDSHVVIEPSPVLVTLPGPILSSFPQNTAVGSSSSAAVGSILSSQGVPISSGGFDLSCITNCYGGNSRKSKVTAFNTKIPPSPKGEEIEKRRFINVPHPNLDFQVVLCSVTTLPVCSVKKAVDPRLANGGEEKPRPPARQELLLKQQQAEKRLPTHLIPEEEEEELSGNGRQSRASCQHAQGLTYPESPAGALDRLLLGICKSQHFFHGFPSWPSRHYRMTPELAPQRPLLPWGNHRRRPAWPGASSAPAGCARRCSPLSPACLGSSWALPSAEGLPFCSSEFFWDTGICCHSGFPNQSLSSIPFHLGQAAITTWPPNMHHSALCCHGGIIARALPHQEPAAPLLAVPGGAVPSALHVWAAAGAGPCRVLRCHTPLPHDPRARATVPSAAMGESLHAPCLAGSQQRPCWLCPEVPSPQPCVSGQQLRTAEC